MPIITLTTDFGTRDSYVGAMKGVLLSLAPDAQLVDIAHDVPAHDIIHGAFVIAQAAPFFPAGTIHIGVIDPGVGGSRKPICAHGNGQFFVGPDNGLCAILAHSTGKKWTVHQLTNPTYFRPEISSTFHGRDIFAPVAAHLARGESPEAFGPRLDHPHALELPQLITDEHELVGEVIYVDHFGSAVTNIRRSNLPTTTTRPLIVRTDEVSITGLSRSYEDRETGEPLALMSSADLLEISIRDGNAAEELDLQRGSQVTVCTSS